MSASGGKILLGYFGPPLQVTVCVASGNIALSKGNLSRHLREKSGCTGRCFVDLVTAFDTENRESLSYERGKKWVSSMLCVFRNTTRRNA